MSPRIVTDRHVELLLELLAIPTVGPLETGRPARLRAAQEACAAHAARFGFEVERHASADPAVLARHDVPLPVRAAAERLGPEFLAGQPNLVLRLGERRSPDRTIMFNVHLDTVDGYVPIGLHGGRVTGRGAVDAKGPAVALLAGLERAVGLEPGLTDTICVLVQLVGGEEGGAMGVFGTRDLVEAGYVGRLNVFCEPTGSACYDRCTASMTARLAVDGVGAIDDEPGAGHNATVILGYLAQHLARTLPPIAAAAGGRVCIAGIETGPLHNRVYGSGRLLVNIAYESTAAARALEEATEAAFADGCRSLAGALDGVQGFARTARELTDVTTLEWLKRGLPVLSGRDPGIESLLAECGIERHPDPGFTCDAIWMDGCGGHTIVYGPGSLDANRAHADGEFVDLDDLDDFARTVSRLVVSFARSTR